MFENVGKKIKGITIIFFIIGVILSMAGAFSCFSGADSTYVDALELAFIIGGIACITVGPLLSWLLCLCLYGYGELIDKTQEIAACLAPRRRNAQKIETAKKLFSEGLISEAEYRKAIGE